MTCFIQQFAEQAKQSASYNPARLGTATATKSIEGSDQDDNSAFFTSSMGTRTSTASIEGVDQDPHSEWLMGSGTIVTGTGTATESIEGLDQDRANNFFEI